MRSLDGACRLQWLIFMLLVLHMSDRAAIHVLMRDEKEDVYVLYTSERAPITDPGERSRKGRTWRGLGLLGHLPVSLSRGMSQTLVPSLAVYRQRCQMLLQEVVWGEKVGRGREGAQLHVDNEGIDSIQNVIR